MPAQWTGELVGKMHLYDIQQKELAGRLGITPEYVNAVLRGKRDPTGAEARFKAAVDELIAERVSTTPKV